MKCRDIMKTDIKSAGPEEPVSQVARRMKNENVGFLPICDEEGKIVGTVTDRDLAIRVVAEGSPSSIRVGDVMSSGAVVMCRPDDSLEVAEHLMSNHRVSRIVCCEGTTLLGVISLSDIAQHEGDRGTARVLAAVSEREARP